MTKDTLTPTKINAELIYYQLSEINKNMAEMKLLYVTKVESQALKAEIEELRKDVQEIRRSRNIMGWVIPSVTAVFTAVVTYLTIEFFKSK